MLTVNSKFFLKVFNIYLANGHADALRLDNRSGIFSFGVRMVVVVGYLMLDLHGSLVQYPSKHGLISTCSPSRPHKF